MPTPTLILPPRTTRTWRALATDIKLAHSVFALPFALLGAFMAAPRTGAFIDWSRFGRGLPLILGAMFFARTAAMIANRVVDREIDARNPRTRHRALPGGRVTLRQARAAWLAAAALFMATCALFGPLLDNWWPLVLGLPVLVWLSAYGLLKRSTAACHLYLGASLALSVPAAALAIDPEAIGAPPLWLLAGMVLTWVAGFDILYALQDLEVDRRDGLHSIPAWLGETGAIGISRMCHALAACLLVASWRLDSRLCMLFGIGVGASILLLVLEHWIIARRGRAGIPMAFFTLNGIVSCLLGLLGIADLIRGHGG